LLPFAEHGSSAVLSYEDAKKPQKTETLQGQNERLFENATNKKQKHDVGFADIVLKLQRERSLKFLNDKNRHIPFLRSHSMKIFSDIFGLWKKDSLYRRSIKGVN